MNSKSFQILFLPLFCCFFAFGSNAPVFSQNDKNSSEASAKKVLRDWQKAFEADDANEHMKLYSRISNLNIIFSSGASINKIEDLKKEYEETYDNFDFANSRLKIESISATSHAAWAVCTHQVEMKEKELGRKYKLHVKTSFVLKKDGKNWRIVLEHSSPIRGIERIREIR